LNEIWSARIQHEDVLIDSITNAATYILGPIAPGEIITIKGSGLGPLNGISFSLDPSETNIGSILSGTRVLINEIASPILYASSTQVNAVVPNEIAGSEHAVIQVEYRGFQSKGIMLSVAVAAPGVFTNNGTGSGQASAENQDGSPNGIENAARKGSNVSIYFTGGGLTEPPGITGSIQREWKECHQILLHLPKSSRRSDNLCRARLPTELAGAAPHAIALSPGWLQGRASFSLSGVMAQSSTTLNRGPRVSAAN
jgi:uncharacterized protein (TIGR03437 family)